MDTTGLSRRLDAARRFEPGYEGRRRADRARARRLLSRLGAGASAGHGRRGHGVAAGRRQRSGGHAPFEAERQAGAGAGQPRSLFQREAAVAAAGDAQADAPGPRHRAPAIARTRRADSYTLPVDVVVHTVQPHAHYVGRRFEGTATLPDGRIVPLIQIRDWNFNWQDVYHYRDPIALPAGTRIDMRIVYDNSDAQSAEPAPAAAAGRLRPADRRRDGRDVVPGADAQRSGSRDAREGPARQGRCRKKSRAAGSC